jgi:hypothetical protein
MKDETSQRIMVLVGNAVADGVKFCVESLDDIDAAQRKSTEPTVWRCGDGEGKR